MRDAAALRVSIEPTARFTQKSSWPQPTFHLEFKSARKQDWAAFANAYNGAGYKKNLYDAKLKTAYDLFAEDELKG